MRKLILVPIIHTEADMGSMAGPLRKEFIARFGARRWREHTKTIDDLWRGIERKINGMELDYPTLTIYQDGLPVCGKEREIVRGVAGLGSRNHKLILDLMTKGASIEGTESSELLMEEYRFIRELTHITDPHEKKKVIEKCRGAREELLKKRDRFIAQRIHKTLKDDHTGLLFIGLEHEIEKWLPENIQVSHLIYRLPFKKLRDF